MDDCCCCWSSWHPYRPKLDGGFEDTPERHARQLSLGAGARGRTGRRAGQGGPYQYVLYHTIPYHTIRVLCSTPQACSSAKLSTRVAVSRRCRSRVGSGPSMGAHVAPTSDVILGPVNGVCCPHGSFATGLAERLVGLQRDRAPPPCRTLLCSMVLSMVQYSTGPLPSALNYIWLG